MDMTWIPWVIWSLYLCLPLTTLVVGSWALNRQLARDLAAFEADLARRKRRTGKRHLPPRRAQRSRSHRAPAMAWPIAEPQPDPYPTTPLPLRTIGWRR